MYDRNDEPSEFSFGRSRGNRDATVRPGRPFPSTVTPISEAGETYRGTIAGDTVD